MVKLQACSLLCVALLNRERSAENAHLMVKADNATDDGQLKALAGLGGIMSVRKVVLEG